MKSLGKYLRKRLFQMNEARKDKTFVFIVCTMRSGSTLLKSLLANAPDISYLPEVDFQKYCDQPAVKIKILSVKRIIILKKPANFEQSDYPLIPRFKNAKVIVLVRDVHDNVLSVQKMLKEIFPNLSKDWPLEKLVDIYWYNTYKNILNKTESLERHFVKYEDLISQAENETQRIFQFIGSKQAKGVSSYQAPETYSWQWGKDDGGELIKSLHVNTNVKTINPKLQEIISKSDKINILRNQLGYK